MTTALLLIDIQKGFDCTDLLGETNNPQMDQNAEHLLNHARKFDWQVVIVQHASSYESGLFYPSKPTFALKPTFEPQAGEWHIIKDVHSAFIGTDLQERLDKAGIKKLVICGICTDLCVSTTARMSNNLGFETTVVGDACRTFGWKNFDGNALDPNLIHDIHLITLQQEFATVVNTNTILSANSTL